MAKFLLLIISDTLIYDLHHYQDILFAVGNRIFHLHIIIPVGLELKNQSFKIAYVPRYNSYNSPARKCMLFHVHYLRNFNQI